MVLRLKNDSNYYVIISIVRICCFSPLLVIEHLYILYIVYLNCGCYNRKIYSQTSPWALGISEHKKN